MYNRWLPLILRGLIAALLVAILVSGWFVMQAAIRKPTTPRTAAERALMDGEEAVKSDPKSVEARLSLAAAYIGVGRNDDALDMLSVTLKLDPKNVRALYMQGVAHKNQGQLDEAIASFKKAAETKGEIGAVYADIYYDLGKTYEQRNDYKSAIDAYVNAVSNDVRVYVLSDLAATYEKVGNIKDAQITYLNVLARDVENQEALTALKRLRVPQQVIDDTIRGESSGAALETKGK